MERDNLAQVGGGGEHDLLGGERHRCRTGSLGSAGSVDGGLGTICEFYPATFGLWYQLDRIDAPLSGHLPLSSFRKASMRS
ncbi:hypothetical protein QJS10_CPB12g01005 [Acorus calamus]|uniref:Uncharacterized protein n=1 Tax=Acorus calamus TaxID=4465 RepID=A0AAV9DIA9_ACOCL|nr:hypothetical protein QJS10_CPB12g01005 [Acorus calamus]